MTRPSLTVPALLLATVALPALGQAQTFKVDKWNIGGEGGTDYVTAEPGTGRVFVSRQTHVMVVDGATGKVLGDIPDTPRTHGIALAPKSNHGFITNGGDSTVTMFDLKTLAVIKKIKVPIGGLDGVMYEDFSDRIILTNHSRPIGTATALDAKTGDIVGSAELEDNGPEGAASDGKGKIFVNNEGKNTIQVLDVKTMKVLASWSLAPCEGPTGIAYDRATKRIFSGCGKTSVVVDAGSGGGRDDRQRRRGRRPGLGPVPEADLHPGRPGQQRHRGPSGLVRQVRRGRYGDHAAGCQDYCRRPGEARSLPVPARVRSAPGAGPRSFRACPGRPRRPARPDRRRLVLRDQPLILPPP